MYIEEIFCKIFLKFWLNYIAIEILKKKKKTKKTNLVIIEDFKILKNHFLGHFGHKPI
jgi:hypothetical protein